MELAGLLIVVAGSVYDAPIPAFEPDANHPWNQLHRELYTRIALDGTPYFGDGVDGSRISRQRFYITDWSAQNTVVHALETFISFGGETLINDPVKRALLQRDLWSVFDATVSSAPTRYPQPRKLHKLLARVMGRVALSPGEFAALPDNLDQAIDAGAFPAAYDDKHADRDFLPVELLDPSGNWVLVANQSDTTTLTARIHVNATSGRSAFFVFIRVSAGRDATVKYLTDLRKSLEGGNEPLQIPRGTQVALLRRTLLIDSAGIPRLTSLTESLQIRVYEQLDRPEFFEFVMNRDASLPGSLGSLTTVEPHRVSPRELSEVGIGFDVDVTDGGEEARTRQPEVETCTVCHAGPGIFGFQSVFAHPGPSLLGPTTFEEQSASTIDYTLQTPAWKLLEDLLQANEN